MGKKQPEYEITRFEQRSFRNAKHRIVGNLEFRPAVAGSLSTGKTVPVMATACGLNAMNLADHGGCGVTAWDETTCPYCLEARPEYESRGIRK